MTVKEIIQGLLDEMYNMGIDEENVAIACDNKGIGELSRRLLPLLKAAKRFVKEG